MILALQLLALFFGVVMIYLTFLYYKRNCYDNFGFVTWTLIWAGFIIMAMFPTTIYGVMETLDIHRTVDFFVISGFLVFSVMIFKTYSITRQTQRKMEILVKKVAKLTATNATKKAPQRSARRHSKRAKKKTRK